MITNLQNLQNIFNQMANDGVDINNKLLWSFFFFDKNKLNIEEIKRHFSSTDSYDVEIDLMNDGYWRLKTSYYRIFTPDLLHQQNINYNELAEKFSIELYDGWDVDVSFGH